MRLALFILLVAFLRLLALAGEPCGPGNPSLSEVAQQKSNTLSGPFSVDALENQNMIVDRQSGQALPFGYANKAWIEMKDAMRAGDQIYFLVHRDGNFHVEGHILVRNGCIIRRMQGSIS